MWCSPPTRAEGVAAVASEEQRLGRQFVTLEWHAATGKLGTMELGVKPMSAPIANDHFDFSLGNLSYINSAYDEPYAPAKPLDPRISVWVARLVSMFREWWHRRAVIQELSLMTDRELSDIGLSRSDLARVFDPAFAAARDSGHEYIAY
jgi:uncharacterized protein YjiS (DUF1127 family)